MNERDDLLSIGRFAEASRLSRKALRIYDRLGLLRPVHVDQRSHYRYYHPEQLRKAKIIGLLRRLDLPLETIRDILEAEGLRAVDILTAYWREVEARTGVGRRIVAYLEEILRGGEAMDFMVKTRTVPGTQALSMLEKVYVRDLPAFIDRAIHALYRQAGAQARRTIGHPTVIYHGEVNEDSSGPVEVCLPVEGGTGDTEEGMRLIEFPAGTEAYTTITGAQCRFPEILRAYDAVHAWITRNGRTPAGPPREIYFSDREQPEGDEPFCDIAWPIR